MTTIHGQIEKIIYRNDENGYVVALLRVMPKSQPSKLNMNHEYSGIIVGSAVSIKEGEFFDVEGEWVSHPKYKKQFKFTKCTPVKPTGLKALYAYLSSGFITGIGPELADRIINKFGEKTLDIIEHDIERLIEVNGIGVKKLAVIKDSWDTQKKIRDLVFFLQENDISGALANRIYNAYGDLAINKIKENPYILVRDIYGVGFHTADSIAAKLGIPEDSIFRAEAAVLHIIMKYLDEGSTYCPIEELVEKTNDLIHIDINIIHRAIDSLETQERVVIDNTFGIERVYLKSYFKYETKAATSLIRLISEPKTIDTKSFNLTKEIALIEDQNKIELADEQKQAIISAIQNKVVIITGGPGVGKTTIINSIIQIFYKLKLGFIELAAPTGKAAKRMSEVTGHEARTIHRLLEYDPMIGRFQRYENNPLVADMVIIDEASMIDVPLFYSLVQALPKKCTFVLVGDVNQLPSVGAGNVLKDIIASEQVPVIRLNKIFRQSKESLIIVNSHRVNEGEFPYLNPTGDSTDFFYVERNDPNDIRNLIIELVTERIPNKFKFNPLNDIQVLAPMYKGDTGINNLNANLQKKLNHNTSGVQRGSVTFCVGDKIMQIRNNYDKEVFNGDVGIIEAIYQEQKLMIINFDGIKVEYAFNELDEIVLAYATSVHKSQGSEYPAVVIPLTMQHYMLLQRNLLYTGITRGKKLVVLVGEKKALNIAIKNNKTRLRYTTLAEWIKHGRD